jgi:hypothetical protein
MFDTHSQAGLAGSTNSFITAYGRLLDSVERAMSEAGVDGELAAAHQEYAEVVGDVASMSGVQQRLDVASQRLTDVVSRARAVVSARDTLTEASRVYVQEVGDALPTLYAATPEPEALAAIASGMMTLVWLHGAGIVGAGGLPGANSFLGTSAFGAWPAGNGDAAAAAPTTTWAAGGSFEEDDFGSMRSTASPAGDTEIVWQEFSIAEDGQIRQRAVPSSSHEEQASSEPPRIRPAESSDGETPFARRLGKQSDRRFGDDPVGDVERALSTYQNHLRQLGWVDPVASAVGQVAPTILDATTADLTSAYLRLAQGVGTVPELYASYARFVTSSIQLVERQLALTRTYEQLISAALAGQRPADIRRTADHHYHSFLSEVREAWSRVDIATLTPDQLAAMASSLARAADAQRAAT